MKRRSVVRATGAGALAGIAGCFSREEDDEELDDVEDDTNDDDDEEPDEPDLDGTLRVATTEEVVGGRRAVGDHLREAFEETFDDAELQWTIPEAGLDHYVQRAHLEAEIDADVYFGLTPPALARVDRRLEGRELFRELNTDRITSLDRLRDRLEFGDPSGRVLPTGVRYSCVLYDEDELEEADLEIPETLTTLTEPEHAESLLVPHPNRSDTGLAFFLWTVDAFGKDDAIAYWRDLEDNGARFTESWADSDDAYAAEERPLSVAYSTDPILAVREGRTPDRYGVAFPDEQGYQTPIGAALFDELEEADLAYDFLNFVLSSEVQAKLTEYHLQVPALSSALVDLDEEFEEYADVPSEPVSIGYDQLSSELQEQLEALEAAIGAD
jgi:thiamine transport system substrate-binding protein